MYIVNYVNNVGEEMKYANDIATYVNDIGC